MEKKYVTYKNLKKGQEIHGTKDGNCTRMCSAFVKEINPNFVTVEMWRKGGDIEKISTHCMFAVEMTEKEFEDKYRADAKEVIKDIQNKLHKDEIGYHEMWNSWLYGTPFEIAKACKEQSIKIVGHCSDIVAKENMISGHKQDIGVCAEYEDGERFWCHYSTEMLNDMLEIWGEMLNERADKTITRDY